MKTKELSFSPQLIGNLLDIIHNAILIVDSHHRIAFANQRTARMFATSVGALQKSEVVRLFMPDDLEHLVPNILNIINKEGEFEGEVMFRRLDGSTFLGLLAATLFHWESGKAGIAFTINDISDIKTLEQSLVRSERVAFLGHLIDDISHQIRNPVTVIGGFSRRLSTDCGGSQPAQAIIREANYLEGLLNTLNAFIRLPPPNQRRIRMDGIIASLEGRIADKVRSLGCTWVAAYEPGLDMEHILVDKDLLLEALETIVVNACESYGGESAEPVVRCEVSHDDTLRHPFQIKVIDEGAGIPSESLPLVFSPFFSVKTKHIGMGLSFAQRIVEEQMGRITLESVVSKGTEVVCHLIKERRRAIRIAKMV